MKRFIILLVVFLLMLTSCANVSQKVESTAEKNKSMRNMQVVDTTTEEKYITYLDDEAQTILKNSASILTKSLVGCLSGFSSDVKKPSDKITLNSDVNNATKFLVMMIYHNNSDEYTMAKNSIYSGSIYKDSKDTYHLKKSYISVILKDIFDCNYNGEIEKILDEQLDFEYSSKNDEYLISMNKLMEQNTDLKYTKKSDKYLSDSDFSKDDNWICKRITNVKTDPLKKEIKVKYIVENSYSFDDDSDEEITSYNCENVYKYHLREDNEYYLTVKSVNVVEYVKSTNPDAV